MTLRKFYCRKCGKIKTRLEVARGSEFIGIATLVWHRCRQCGEKVDRLQDAMEGVLRKTYDSGSSD